MPDVEQLRADLGAAMSGADNALAAADLLCVACVDLLDIDGASVSLMHEGSTRGTFGSSGRLSRELDELQFTLGEGPCLDSVRQGRPVLVPDLDDLTERRWPAFGGAMVERGIRAVFALPIAVASSSVGALDLFRRDSGPLDRDAMTGGLWAAELAALPLLDLMTADVDWTWAGEGGSWEQLASLERVEVYQATGMIMSALEVGAADAVVRLRAYAFGHGRTASDVARAVVERRLVPDDDGWRGGPGQTSEEGR